MPASAEDSAPAETPATVAVPQDRPETAMDNGVSQADCAGLTDITQAIKCDKRFVARSRAGKFKPSVNSQPGVAAASNRVNTDYQQARACCQGQATDCVQYFDDNSKKQYAALGASGSSDGMNDAQKVTASNNKNLQKQTAMLAGFCEGYREVCVNDADAANSACENSATCQSHTDATHTFQTSRSSCGHMSSDAIVAQSNAYGNGSADAQNGANQTTAGAGDGSASGGGSGLGGMNPMSLLPALMQMMGQQQPQGDQGTATADCSAGSAVYGCPTAGKPTSWNTQSTGSASPTQSSSSGGFNLADTGAVRGADMGAMSANQGSPITTAGVNGNGGAFNMGAGGAPGGTPSAGQVGAGLQPASKKVELTEGSRSGYSQTAAGMNLQSGGASGGYNYASNDSGGGMRLGDFLPGGMRDPSRAMASLGAARNAEIQDKSVNIWNRISSHMQSRCAQGLLRDCNP
jgi:hypothetical protein